MHQHIEQTAWESRIGKEIKLQTCKSQGGLSVIHCRSTAPRDQMSEHRVGLSWPIRTWEVLVTSFHYNFLFLTSGAWCGLRNTTSSAIVFSMKNFLKSQRPKFVIFGDLASAVTNMSLGLKSPWTIGFFRPCRKLIPWNCHYYSRTYSVTNLCYANSNPHSFLWTSQTWA